MTEDEIRVMSRKRAVAKRLFFLTLAILAFLFMPVMLTIIGELTGITHFSEIFGPLVFWNELSGPGFIVAFFSIVFLTGIIMYLIMVALDTTEGGW
jgi:hypothetical protein